MSEVDDLFDNVLAGDVRDPYRHLAERRRAVAAERTSAITGFPAYAVYRYHDVAEVLRDDETWSAAAAKAIYSDVMGPYVMVGMDEPDHRRYRALASPAFRAKILNHWQDELIRPVIDEAVDAMAAHPRPDLVRQFTVQFPVQVIAGVVGLPREEWDPFRRWSMAIINAGADPARAKAASGEFVRYLSPILEARRADPGTDLLSELATAELDGERLNDEEILSFVRLLVPAGVETTYRSSGTLLFALLSDLEQLDAVRRDPALMPQAIEEALRWEAPVLITTRIARHDGRIAGVDVPKGSWVVAHLGSANRDEDRWEEPWRYDLFRPPQPHLSFGHGPHVCLGMHLARLETRLAVTALLERYPDLRLDPGDDDPHIHGGVFRSPTCLPVRLA